MNVSLDKLIDKFDEYLCNRLFFKAAIRGEIKYSTTKPFKSLNEIDNNFVEWFAKFNIIVIPDRRDND